MWVKNSNFIICIVILVAEPNSDKMKKPNYVFPETYEDFEKAQKDADNRLHESLNAIADKYNASVTNRSHVPIINFKTMKTYKPKKTYRSDTFATKLESDSEDESDYVCSEISDNSNNEDEYDSSDDEDEYASSNDADLDDSSNDGDDSYFSSRLFTSVDKKADGDTSKFTVRHKDDGIYNVELTNKLENEANRTPSIESAQCEPNTLITSKNIIEEVSFSRQSIETHRTTLIKNRSVKRRRSPHFFYEETDRKRKHKKLLKSVETLNVEKLDNGFSGVISRGHESAHDTNRKKEVVYDNNNCAVDSTLLRNKDLKDHVFFPFGKLFNSAGLSESHSEKLNSINITNADLSDENSGYVTYDELTTDETCNFLEECNF